MLRRASISLLTLLIFSTELSLPLKAASEVRADSKNAAGQGPFADIEPLEQIRGKTNLYTSSISRNVLKGSVSRIEKLHPCSMAKSKVFPKELNCAYR